MTAMLQSIIAKYDPIVPGTYKVIYCIGNMRGRNTKNNLQTELLQANSVYDAITQIKQKHGPTSECKSVERMG